MSVSSWALFLVQTFASLGLAFLVLRFDPLTVYVTVYKKIELL